MAEERKHTLDGRYYAEGDRVWRAPLQRRKDDGTSSVTLGFAVCKMCEPASDQAGTLAIMLNQAAAAADLLAALQGLVAPQHEHGTACGCPWCNARAAIKRATEG